MIEFVFSHMFTLLLLCVAALATAVGGLVLFVSATLASASFLFIWGCAGRRSTMWLAWVLAALPMAAGGLAAACIGSLLLYGGFGGLRALGFSTIPLFPALTVSALVLSGHAACVGLGRGISTRFRHTTPTTATVGAGVAAVALGGAIFFGGVYWIPCGLVALGIIGGGVWDRDLLALGITATALHAASVALVSVWVVTSSSFDAGSETLMLAIVSMVLMVMGAIVPTLAVLGTLIVGAVESQSHGLDTPTSPAVHASTDLASSPTSGFTSPAPLSANGPSTSSRYATKATWTAA